MKHFGTDGIRKKADAFTTDLLNSIATGLAHYADEIIDRTPKVLLAGDTRESSEWIIRDLEIALESLGFDYATADVLPTPAINYCFYQMGFDFAIDVTASHNPYTDNGIKIFERGPHSGIKLSEPGQLAIEDAIAKNQPLTLISTSPRENLHAEALALYEEHLKSYVKNPDLSSLHLAIDCANGATSVIGDSIFKSLGASTVLINANPNYGTEINNNCGSTHLEQLVKTVLEHHLDFGVAFDGDGDRCLLVDHTGTIIDGDQIIAIIASHLNLDAIAVTVMANQGLLNWAKSQSIATEITAVGDSNVATAMFTKGIKIGGEQSGHIILPGEPTGDGMLTALVLASIVAESGKSLSNLASIVTKYPQVIINLPATPEQKDHLKTSSEAKQLLLEYDQKLTPVSGRLLVRPSGTENLIRITLWGNDEPTIATLAEELKTKLGAIL